MTQPPNYPPNYYPPQQPPRIITAKGYTGTVTFDGRMITIRRTGLGRATVGKGDMSIPLRQVTGVQFKPAGWMVNGYISFTIPGAVGRNSRAGAATTGAVRDQDAVVFTKQQAHEFEVLRDAVNWALGGL